MSELNYRPSGELQGDTKPITDKGGSMSGDYSKSLGEASKADLAKGYCDKSSMTSDTKSDKGFA